MGTKDPKVDAYIEKSAVFARPILKHMRRLVHAGCPDVEETLKWGFPHFMCNDAILCNMAAFKRHCAFGFWHIEMRSGGDDEKTDEAMGQFGRIESIADLPDDETMLRMVKKAAALNRDKGKAQARSKAASIAAKKPPDVPADLQAALQNNKQALATFENFSPTHKKEYIEWITGAKRPETRHKRLTTAIEWMAEGRIRHWKYIR